MPLIENLSVISLEDYLARLEPWDLFVCCSSFEERCKRSSEILRQKEVKIGTSILYNYKETDSENLKEKNAKIMEENLRQISRQVLPHCGESVSSPHEGMAKFLLFLKENNVSFLNKEIAVDITVFTKPFFFLLFRVLKEKFRIRHVYVIYTEPEKYKGKNPDADEIILTEGLDRVESIPGFTGSSINPKEALIVQLGFEGKRALDVFNSINPEIVYAINGFPSYQPGWHKISFEENMRFLSESRSYEHLFSAPAADPFETEKVVSKVAREIKQKGGLNIVIAPLGTKIQAFGALLYALKDDDTKVVYPFPSFYKADYSYKFGPSWIFKTAFDDDSCCGKDFSAR
jgi:hypothetical protein